MTTPTKPGCYENQGSGWVKVPCSCELWLKNTDTAPASVAIELTMAPGAPVPKYGGPLEVSVGFDDADATWYAAWQKQAASGDAFAVTRHGNVTTVMMAASSVSLAPVALSSCRRRDATATVTGVVGATLSMHAALVDPAGNPISTVDASCEDIPPEGSPHVGADRD
jgi:hypothetical protein